MNYPKMEEEILQYWKENDVFRKSLENRKGGKRFVFLEGPPTANGLPHPGHVLTRAVKDAILRYKTMKGYYVARKAGWDTHGLPVEIEVEKILGLKNKQDIEKFGIEKFNQECKKNVFKYEEAWKKMTERVGFWIDMENPYITLDNSYIESVWWSLKEAWKKGLLYRGYRVTPYCPRCGTTLSSHEVAQGYREVEDISIFVKFKIKGKDEFLLAWTTTPWTLISNVALAVHPDELYVKIEYNGEKIIMAEERAKSLLKEYRVIDVFKGKELYGIEYEPLYKFIEPDKKCWYVVTADFVTMDEGTGIVHIAPAFGEEDYEVGVKHDLPLIQLVDGEGKFKKEVGWLSGKFIKDADAEIIEDLRKRKLLEGEQKYKHQYPFCWRCDSPLIYYAIESWFIGMSKLRENLLKNNEEINWYPENLKYGRFYDFIREVRDWALSRKRYWGTPLPIWVCEKCKKEICIGSIEELKNLAGKAPPDMHRPFIDEVLIDCQCGGKMKRVEEVIDAWYDSGCAFFAQWHYPFENEEEFLNNFPADFICEALDQTRGWFYSLLAVSTLLFDKPCYKNVLSLGLILDEEGQKMSKRARNYVEPDEIFSKYGADALRWYLLSSSPPWQPKRFYERPIKDVLSQFLLTLWNVYYFYKTYSSLDKFDYEKNFLKERKIIDRWVLSRLQKVIIEIDEKMEGYELHKVCRAIEDFVLNDLSNWYIRVCRKRFWSEEQTFDKLSGYSTLYEVLSTLAKIIAPFAPFIAEKIYLEMKNESVHLCDFPLPDRSFIDEELEKKMDMVRNIAEIARSLRAKNNIKIRYPLKELIVSLEENIEELADIIKEEANVKKIIFTHDIEQYMEKKIKANLTSLGKKYKRDAKDIAILIERAKIDELKKGKILFKGKEYKISEEDYRIEIVAKEGYVFGEDKGIKVLLNTVRTPELIAEGFAREIVRRIQQMRKETGLEMEERIVVEINISKNRIEGWENYVKNETRSVEIKYCTPEHGYIKEWEIDDEKIIIGINKI